LPTKNGDIAQQYYTQHLQSTQLPCNLIQLNDDNLTAQKTVPIGNQFDSIPTIANPHNPKPANYSNPPPQMKWHIIPATVNDNVPTSTLNFHHTVHTSSPALKWHSLLYPKTHQSPEFPPAPALTPEPATCFITFHNTQQELPMKNVLPLATSISHVSHHQYTNPQISQINTPLAHVPNTVTNHKPSKTIQDMFATLQGIFNNINKQLDHLLSTLALPTQASQLKQNDSLQFTLLPHYA